MRTIHKIYAWLFGYFWLPCPMCGRMFGGHEIVRVHAAALVGDDGKARCVCPDPMCSHDAAALNAQKGFAVWVRSNDALSRADVNPQPINSSDSASA